MHSRYVFTMQEVLRRLCEDIPGCSVDKIKNMARSLGGEGETLVDILRGMDIETLHAFIVMLKLEFGPESLVACSCNIVEPLIIQARKDLRSKELRNSFAEAIRSRNDLHQTVRVTVGEKNTTSNHW